MSVLAVIPARIGSKGIYHKNIRPFAGYPLIAWSIAAAQKATLVSNMVVTTDSQEIAEVARKYGAYTILRPSWLGEDDTHDLDVFIHLLSHSWAEPPEYLVQLRPTSPIRPTNMVDDAIKMLWSRSTASSLRAVTEATQNPFKCWTISNGVLNPIAPFPNELSNKPRQLLPQAFWQTGHIDVMRTSQTIEVGMMSGYEVIPMLVDQEYVADLDNGRQWQVAEAKIGGFNSHQIVRPG